MSDERIQELETENERLRETLREIEELTCGGQVIRISEVARAALHPIEAKIQIVSMQLGDTGLGREAGFKDDAELIAAAKAEREGLSPEMQELTRKIDVDFERAALFGEQGKEDL